VGQDKGCDYIASTLIYANHYTEAAFVPAELIPFTGRAGRTQTIVVYSVWLQTNLLGGQLGFFEEKVCSVKASEYAQGWADDAADDSPGGLPGA